MGPIALYDGTVINSRNFEIHHTTARRLTVADMNNLHLAHKVCANAPEYSVVIARKAGIVGLALGEAKGNEACDKAAEMMRRALMKNGRRLHIKRAVAVLNFFPTEMQIIGLGLAGVDVIFVLVRDHSGETGREQGVIDTWIYERKQYKRQKTRDPREPITEFVWPRHIFIQPKWKAKEWEK